MTKFKGITLNVLILIGVFALLILTQSCGTVSGIGQDIQDMSDWSKDKLTTTMETEEVSEATPLPAPTRPIGGQELQDYLGRIEDRKKGKTDKYKLPYIHRSSVVKFKSPDGKTYDEDKIKQALAQRPKKLLKQNEKMRHSNGALEQFFNIGFAALVGVAIDESTNELIVVNTCPGAGSCKVIVSP